MLRGLSLLMVTAVASMIAPAQSANIQIVQSVIASGGAKSVSVSGAAFSVVGTIGQGVAGTKSTDVSSQFSILGGFWSSDPLAPTAAAVRVSGRTLTARGEAIRGVVVVLTGPDGSRTVRTNTFGYFRFDGIPAGETYVLEASIRRFRFAPVVVSVVDDMAKLEIVAIP